MSGVLSPLKWTPLEIAVLRAITESDRPLYKAEIVERTGVHGESVYAILQRLNKWRIITEANGPDNTPITRSRNYFEATPRGRIEAAKRCGTDVPRETKQEEQCPVTAPLDPTAPSPQPAPSAGS